MACAVQQTEKAETEGQSQPSDWIWEEKSASSAAKRVRIVALLYEARPLMLEWSSEETSATERSVRGERYLRI